MNYICPLLKFSVSRNEVNVPYTRFCRTLNYTTNPFARPRGRKRILERHDLEYFDGLLRFQPGLYLDELQDKLRVMRDVEVSPSDIILMDDNFSAIVKAIMRGRCVNDTVRKFLQFQILTNVTAVVITFVIDVALDEKTSALTAVQLIWINHYHGYLRRTCASH
jgi:hypothetical protein